MPFTQIDCICYNQGSRKQQSNSLEKQCCDCLHQWYVATKIKFKKIHSQSEDQDFDNKQI